MKACTRKLFLSTHLRKLPEILENMMGNVFLQRGDRSEGRQAQELSLQRFQLLGISRLEVHVHLLLGPMTVAVVVHGRFWRFCFVVTELQTSFAIGGDFQAVVCKRDCAKGCKALAITVL